MCLFAIYSIFPCIVHFRSSSFFLTYVFGRTVLVAACRSWASRFFCLPLPAACVLASRCAAFRLGERRLWVGAGAQRLWAGGLRWPQEYRNWWQVGRGDGALSLRWKSASCPLDHEGCPACFCIGLSFSSCLAGEFCIYSRHKPLLKCVGCQYSLPVCSFSYSLNRVLQR